MAPVVISVTAGAFVCLKGFSGSQYPGLGTGPGTEDGPAVLAGYSRGVCSRSDWPNLLDVGNGLEEEGR